MLSVSVNALLLLGLSAVFMGPSQKCDIQLDTALQSTISFPQNCLNSL